MSTGVRIGGKVYPLLHPITGHPIPTFDVADHKIEFKAGDGYNKKRTKDIELGVFHWTGSENAVETMAETLRKRLLGVEYAISPMASLYQFCDMLEVDTADAGIVNSRSWGVEIVNQGVRSWDNLWREPRTRKPPMGPRPSYDTIIHGKKVRCWDFYTEQKMTAFALNKLISEVVPTYRKDVQTYPGVLSSKSLRGLQEDKEANIYGAVGHYNITTEKLDPGPQFMKELAAFMNRGALYGSGIGSVVAVNV